MIPPGAINGFKVVVPAYHWPQEQTGVERLPAHPLIIWLARWLPLRTWWAERPIYRDSPMMIDQRRGYIYCSERQYQDLKNETARLREVSLE
jgi:hypothetical protein